MEFFVKFKKETFGTCANMNEQASRHCSIEVKFLFGRPA